MVVSDNVQLECSPDGRVHTLVIEKVGADVEGEYTVRATTDSAQISSSASIVIQRRLYTCTRKRRPRVFRRKSVDFRNLKVLKFVV